MKILLNSKFFTVQFDHSLLRQSIDQSTKIPQFWSTINF
jgi:hypothetical protein